MLEYLQQRAQASRARRQDQAKQAGERQAQERQVREQITAMRQLLSDPRHAGYTALLQEAARQCELDLYDTKDSMAVTALHADTADAVALKTERLRGRLDVLHIILTMPDIFLSLAERLKTAEGNGVTASPSPPPGVTGG